MYIYNNKRVESWKEKERKNRRTRFATLLSLLRIDFNLGSADLFWPRSFVPGHKNAVSS